MVCSLVGVVNFMLFYKHDCDRYKLQCIWSTVQKGTCKYDQEN